MKKFYRSLNPLKQSLPKTLCFDEFKSVRSVSSAMSFIMMDGDTHELLDILENRRLPYLERYFMRFSSEVREAVQWVVIDMYAPYVSLVKKVFPNAKLIEDCLTRDISGLPETYTTTLRTFKKFLPQIQNALHYSYSNGPLECLNNHIKVFKRNAYGFRSFYNFKLRIMIRHGKTILTK